MADGQVSLVIREDIEHDLEGLVGEKYGFVRQILKGPIFNLASEEAGTY